MKHVPAFRLPLPVVIPAIAIPALLVFMFIGVTFAHAEQTDTPLSTAEVARRVTPSVVTIRTPTGYGSGVIIDQTGLIVTALHVIQGAPRAEVTISNGDIYDDITVVAYNERRDLVALQITALNITPAALGNSDAVEQGENVVVVGSPSGLDFTVSEGIVSARRPDPDGGGYRVLQTTAPASPGSSGGGMFDTYGQLIGIVASQISQGQNLNFALPINYVRELLLSTGQPMTVGELAGLLGNSASATDVTPTSHAVTAQFTALMENFAALIADDPYKNSLEAEDRGNGFWVTTYRGADNIDGLRAAVTLADNDTPTATVNVVTASLTRTDRPTEAQLRSLLRLNSTTEYAKVALDNDGAIYTKTELDLAILDAYRVLRAVVAVSEALDDAVDVLNSRPGARKEPHTPSHPEPNQNIAGRWSGSIASSTASWQDGGCIGQAFRDADISIQSDTTWHVNQSGPQVTGSIAIDRRIGTLDPFTINLGFSGTLVSNDLRGTVGNGYTERYQLDECGPEEWVIDWEAMVFSGTVSETQIDVVASQRGAVRNNTDSYDISSSEQWTLRK